jgi:hypothetical protein
MKKTITLLLFVLLTACSTTKNKQSKSEKSETKTEIVATENQTIKTDAETNTKTTTESSTNTETNEVTETTTIEPIDATKPATFTNESGAVINLNNSKVVKSKTSVLKSDKSKSNIVVDKGEKVAQIEQNDKKTLEKRQMSSSKKESNKEVETKSILLQFWWLWILIAIAIYIGWKNKSKLFL